MLHPSGILVSGPGRGQNWMWAGGFGHYAIIYLKVYKHRKIPYLALKIYLNLRFYTIIFMIVGIKWYISTVYNFIAH